MHSFRFNTISNVDPEIEEHFEKSHPSLCPMALFWVEKKKVPTRSLDFEQ